MRFLHLSDLHIHKKREDNEEVQRLFSVLRSKYPEHYLLVTGDITDDGHPEQYDHAFDFLASFKGRVFVCPGNHDYGLAGNLYDAERAALFDAKLMDPLEQGGDFRGAGQPVVNVVSDDNNSVAIIALDSNLETAHPFDFACGEIGEQQLVLLDEALREAGTRKKILMLHHHPLMRHNPFMMLKDAKQLWRTVYGRVDVMIFGHKHEWDEWWWLNGVRRVVASDDTAMRRRCREITVRRDQIEIRALEL